MKLEGEGTLPGIFLGESDGDHQAHTRNIGARTREYPATNHYLPETDMHNLSQGNEDPQGVGCRL